MKLPALLFSGPISVVMDLNPAVSWTSFGSSEGEDIQAALDYLRTLKSADGQTLVGDKVGLYGIELGAYASLRTRD